jgi:hypothetical protein
VTPAGSTWRECAGWLPGTAASADITNVTPSWPRPCRSNHPSMAKAGTCGPAWKDSKARSSEGMDITGGLRMALALTAICQDSLYNEPGLTGGGDPVVTITADAGLLLATDGEAGAEVTAGPRIGPMALDELLCIGRTELNVATADGNLLGVGKTTTNLPPRLRRAVIARDGGCVIDGCTSRYIPLPASGSLPPSQAPGDKKSITSTNAPTAAPTTRAIWQPCAGYTTTSSSTGEGSPSTLTVRPAADASNDRHHRQSPEPHDSNPASANPEPTPGHRRVIGWANRSAPSMPG